MIFKAHQAGACQPSQSKTDKSSGDSTHCSCGLEGAWAAPSESVIFANGLDVSEGALLAASTEGITASIPDGQGENEVSREIARLCEEIQSVTHDIRAQVARRAQNDRHIQWLHAYNEIKDVAQGLLGQLALHQGGVTRDMYAQYDLELDD